MRRRARRSVAAGAILVTKIGKQIPAADASAASALAPTGSTALAHLTRTYAIATENSANYGVALDRADTGVTCGAFNGGGHVYSGMWQGTHNGDADSYIEAGTAKCRPESPGDAKWFAARTINGVQDQTFIQNGDLNTSHHWKITAENARWKLYIDGQLRHDYGGKDYANPQSTADVGLEVSNRPNAAMGPTSDDNLLAFIGPENGWQPWSGRDSCHEDTGTKGAWSDSDTWKYAYRQDMQGGQRCAT